MFGNILIIDGVDYGYLLLFTLFALLFFGLQLLLCLKAKRTGWKLLPIYFIGLLFLFSLLTALGVFGKGSGFIDATGIFALFFAIAAGIMLVGDILAWLIFLLFQKSKRQ